MIITLTEVEYAEGAGPGLFSCQGGGVFGGCYPEVKGGSKGLCCVVYVLWVRAERRCCLCWCCEVVRVSSAADAGGRRRAASEPASQPAAHTCCVVLSTHPNPTTTRARNCALRWDARPTLMMHTHPHPPTQINPPPHTHPHPHPHPHPNTPNPPHPPTYTHIHTQGTNPESQDVAFEGGPGGSHVSRPIKYAVGVWCVPCVRDVTGFWLCYYACGDVVRAVGVWCVVLGCLMIWLCMGGGLVRA